MTTIGDLRDRLRIELHDESEERWQDDILDVHLQRAARELAFVWPREQKTAIQTAEGSRDLDVSSLTGFVRLLAVEYPVDLYPPSYVQFSLFGETLSLLTDAMPGDAEDVNVYWGSLHTLDSMTSTLPAVAEDTVVTGAAAYAAIEWAGFAVNRANLGGPGVIDDYLDWGNQQLKRFHHALARFGRNAGLRSSRLYAATGEAASQSVVRWEA